MREESESARRAKEAATKAKQAITRVEPAKPQEDWALPSMLSCAVPLWIQQFRQLTLDEWQARLKDLDSDDSEFCLRMEYVLHRGLRDSDSAKAFNDLAKSIALLSFCPNGIRCFGSHWESKFDNSTADASP